MFPGRPAPATALNLALLGVAFLCTDSRVGRALKTSTTSLALLISWLALAGYLFGTDSLYRVAPYSSMALHTAIICLLLSVGVLASPSVEPSPEDCSGAAIAQQIGGPAAR